MIFLISSNYSCVVFLIIHPTSIFFLLLSVSDAHIIVNSFTPLFIQLTSLLLFWSCVMSVRDKSYLIMRCSNYMEKYFSYKTKIPWIILQGKGFSFLFSLSFSRMVVSYVYHLKFVQWLPSKIRGKTYKTGVTRLIEMSMEKLACGAGCVIFSSESWD